MKSRFDQVTTLGVDEHIWHHVGERERGPRALTGMVDLTRDKEGRTRARLLDLVAGRSGKACADWLTERGDAFRRRVKVATLDPFHGYKNAIDDQLDDAVAVLDAFHVVKLGGQAVDEVRRRVQQTINGHRGRKDDPYTASGTCFAALKSDSPSDNTHDWRRRSTLTNATSRSSWPGNAPSNSELSTTNLTRRPGGASPTRS